MLIHLPIVVLASLPFTPVADTLPKFDIARECRSESGSQASRALLEKCAEDEAKARDELPPVWGQSSAADRGACVKETSMDGTPSYVELLTCLEMAARSKR